MAAKRSHRSLLPREHGAYAQLAAPMVAALITGAATAAAVSLALAAVCAFLANEPLLVVLGHRGRRSRELDGPRARVRLVVLVAAAASTGIAGFMLADATTRVAAAAAAVPALGLVALGWRREQHSVVGEVVAAVALPALAVPVAMASGVSLRVALVAWVAWAIGYAASVLAVHRVIARHRGKATRVDVALGVAMVLCAVGAAVAARWFPSVLLALPLVAVSAGLVIRAPRASYLRTIGVVLVVASLMAVAMAPMLA